MVKISRGPGNEPTRSFYRTWNRRTFHMIGWSPEKKSPQNTAVWYRKHGDLARVVKLRYNGRAGYAVFLATGGAGLKYSRKRFSGR